LHVKPRHQSEQVSIRANKTEQKLHQDAKRVGFGGFYRARKKQEEGKEKE